MLHLTLRSEYSFGACYGFLEKLHDDYSEDNVIGIADYNTFSVFKLKKLCDKSGVKPIFGYRVNVVEDATVKIKPRGQFGSEYIIIAKNADGLREIFRLTKINSENFYYRPNISYSDIENLTHNVIVISTDPVTTRLDYIGVNFSTHNNVLARTDKKKVFVDQNSFSEPKDRGVYELFAERNSEHKTHPQHILSEEEAERYFGRECIDNLQFINDSVDNFDLRKADSVRYKGKSDLDGMCKAGAKKLGLDITVEPYKSRLKKELDLLIDKDFVDYILVVAEILTNAKKYCLVGPGRGSSGGSLVCYLMGITTFDPIEFGLIFERFVDVNRFDYPDIDSDIPDTSKEKVVKQITARYGEGNVKTISNITKLKARSAISIFAKGMDIPQFETEEVKDNIITRNSGDARSSMCILDTLESTDAGKEFIEKYPEMMAVQYIEGHAKNKGKHAAGVVISNRYLTNYCGIDERDKTVYLDKKDAEGLGLLKVDILGLRTLAVLEECAKLVGFPFTDYYDLPLDDPKAYTVFQERRLSGVFQFEGDAMASINDSIPMENFPDIVACSALGRPGSLSSGGTSRYIQLRRGEREPLYYGDIHKEITLETQGIVVFQEQMMHLTRRIAHMSWKDVDTLRRAASKSLGDEFFDQYKDKFVNGAVEHSGYTEEFALKVWLDISSMGSYAFNKAHSVAYGFISYWCAYAKSHWPLEFVAANLNNSRDDDSALRMLREFYECDQINYTPVDPDKSGLYWSIVDGELLGGLTNIDGIGLMKARDIIKIRTGEKRVTPGIMKKMIEPKTPFDILYPTKHHFGMIYREPLAYDLENLMYINDIKEGEGSCAIIGKLIMCDDIDANDVQSIAKRGGEKLDGPTMKVHARLQDDTGVMMCILSRFRYEEMSQSLLRAKVGDTWFAFIGTVMNGAKILHIEQVANLSFQIGLNHNKEDR